MAHIIDMSDAHDAMQDVADILSVVSLVFETDELSDSLTTDRAHGLKLITNAAIGTLRDTAELVADLRHRSETAERDRAVFGAAEYKRGGRATFFL